MFKSSHQIAIPNPDSLATGTELIGTTLPSSGVGFLSEAAFLLGDLVSPGWPPKAKSQGVGHEARCFVIHTGNVCFGMQDS